MTHPSDNRHPAFPPWLLLGLRGVNGLGRLCDAAGLQPGRITEERLLRKARRATGLSDFGDDSFLPSFRMLVRSYQEEAEHRSLAQRLKNRAGIVSPLKKRLQITEALRQHPEALEVPIRRPVFIASLPRTGTTLLHRLLAQDPSARPLLAYEAFQPAPRPSEIGREPDPRIRRLQRGFRFANTAVPGLRAVHHLDATAPEECNLLLKNAFLLFGDSSPVYRSWLMEQPPEAIEDAYRMYREQLQLIQWTRPQDGHWVLKATFHLYGIAALLKLFPDCRIIMTHRDPHVSLASFHSLVRLGAELELEDSRQADELARYLLDWVEEGLRRAEAARENAGPGQVIDVLYRDLAERPLDTVRRVYEQCGLPYTDAFHTHAEDWLDRHPKNKFGVHAYTRSLEEHGVSHARIESALGWYAAKYGIPSEGSEAPA